MTNKGDNQPKQILRPKEGIHFRKDSKAPTYDYLTEVLLGVEISNFQEESIMLQLAKMLREEELDFSQMMVLFYKMGIMRGSGQLTEDYIQKIYQSTRK